MTPGGKRPSDPFFPELLAPLQALQVTGRVRVALSGGLDSMVLLHLAHRVFSDRPGLLSAIHINHQLQSAASEFEAACRAACQALSVPLEVVPVKVSTDKQSIETAARDARYEALTGRLQAGDLLLMAHHGNDQLETLLFRMLRGTGMRGLDGMPVERTLGKGRLVRPLLAFPRETLHRQALAAGILWQEDPTNAVPDVDRNFLRHEIIPRLVSRWPTLDRRLAATARASREAVQLAELLAQTHFRQLADGPHRIRLAGLEALPLPAQRNLLQWWLGSERHRPVSDEELDAMLNAAPDTMPEINGARFALRRFRDHIYRIHRFPGPVAADQILVPGEPLRDGEFTIHLSASAAPDEPANRFRLTHREGGERVRLYPGGPARALKKWLQEQGVPPWERERLPLIYCRDELVAVGDLWQDSGTERLTVRRETDVPKKTQITGRPD